MELIPPRVFQLAHCPVARQNPRRYVAAPKKFPNKRNQLQLSMNFLWTVLDKQNFILRKFKKTRKYTNLTSHKLWSSESKYSISLGSSSGQVSRPALLTIVVISIPTVVLIIGEGSFIHCKHSCLIYEVTSRG